MAKLSAITTPSLTFDEGAAASTPASGDVVVYAKTDGLLYSKDDAGTETLVSGGVGGGGSGVTVAKRKGGDASDWSVGGATSYTPASAATLQVGVTAAQTTNAGPITVTFPDAFTNPPVVVATIGDATVDGNGLTVMVANVTTTGFDCYPWSHAANGSATGKVHWIAIGI